MYDALEYSEAVSYEVRMMLNNSSPTKGKYDYWKEWKGVRGIFMYNTKSLLALTFDEQTNKKRYTSTGNWTHNKDWLTWPVL